MKNLTPLGLVTPTLKDRYEAAPTRVRRATWRAALRAIGAPMRARLRVCSVGDALGLGRYEPEQRRALVRVDTMRAAFDGAEAGAAYGRAIDRALDRAPKPVRARWSQYTAQYLSGRRVTIGTFLAGELRGEAKRWGSYRVALQRSCERLAFLGLVVSCKTVGGSHGYTWAAGCEDRGLAVLDGKPVTFMPRLTFRGFRVAV